METNQRHKTNYKLTAKVKDDAFTIEKIEHYHLLLNLGHDSLEIGVVDTDSNKCLLLEEYVYDNIFTDYDLLETISHIWDNHILLKAGFWKKIRLSIKNQKFTFIPNSLFEKQSAIDYLKFTTEIISNNEETASYKHLSTECVNIFAYPKQILDFLKSQYPKNNIELTHQTSAFVEGILRSNEAKNSKKIFAQVDRKHLIILATENNNLRLCNRFYFTSVEDFIYYIMFIYNELGYNNEEVELKICGEIAPNSPLYEKANKYVRQVSFAKKPSHLNFSYHFDELFDHKYYNLYAVYLCD